MEISDYLRALHRGWRLLVALTLVGIIVGAAGAALVPPRYEATAKAYVTILPSTTTDPGALNVGAQYAQTVAESYADIATTAIVLDKVSSSLQLGETSAELAKSVTVTTPTGESVLDVVVTDSRPARAAAIANATVNQLSTVVTDFTKRSSSAGSAVEVRAVDPAVAPTSPVFPQPVPFVLIAALIGLIAGALIAVLREAFDTRLRTADDAARVVATPIIGSIIEDRRHSAQAPGDLAGDQGSAAWAEPYRTLRNNLRFMRLDGADRGIVVTSSIAGEGKTTSVVNLGIVLADLGERVILVDADLRRPQLGARFGLESGLGLTDVLIGTSQLDDAIQDWGSRGLKVLPSGSLPPNPNELLQSASMKELIAALNERFDAVIFDTPPLTAVSDAAVLTRATSGAIIVAAAGRVRRAQLARAQESVEQAGGRVLGLVLNRVRSTARAYYSPIPPKGAEL